MKRCVSFAFVVTAGMHIAAFADDHYVDPAGGNVPPYTNALDAATTIQPALDAAAPGDTVWVADGLYTGAGNRDLRFNGKAIALRAEAGAAPVLDCERQAAGFRFFLSGETTNSLIAGLTIVNGSGSGGGGGFFLYDASPTISNCTIRNSYYDYGIGCNGASAPVILDCTISGHDRYAGIVVKESGRARLERCTIAGNKTGVSLLNGTNVIADTTVCSNTVGVSCGDRVTLLITNGTFSANTDRAISATAGAPRFVRAVGCRFEGNRSDYSGGAVSGGKLVLADCSFTGNSSLNDGGAVYSGDLTMSDCVLSNNWAQWDGGAIKCNGSFALTDCLVVSNRAGKGNGGGVCLETTYGEMSGCRIERCRADDHGGGVYAMWARDGGPLLIRDTTIVSNTCGWRGGGLHIDRHDATVSNCVVVGNTGGTRGGGVSIGDLSRVTLYRCTVASNQIPPNIDSCGGGVYCGSTESHPRLINCVINHNAADWGGGIHSWSAYTTITNCTVAWNRAYPGNTYDGGGVLAFFSPVEIGNTIIWSNTPNQIEVDVFATVTARFCCVEGGYTGAANFAAYPLFVDEAAGDFHLLAGSPCIDRGLLAGAPPDDRDGVPRPLDGDGDGMGGIDVGAYEFVSADADTDGDLAPDADELVAGTALLDPSSFLCISSIEPAAGSTTGARLVWRGVAGRCYTVLHATNASGAWATAPGGEALTGVDADMAYTHAAAETTGFYRLGCRLLTR